MFAKAAFKKDLVATAAQVLQRLERERGTDTSPKRLHKLGFARPDGTLGPDGGAHPTAAVKFLLRAQEYVDADAGYLGHFRDLKQVFEIGVGTGYLFAMLKTLLKIEMWGIDADLDKPVVYREMREALGIADRVFAHHVKARQPLPIPPGTEGVTAFRATFIKGWSVADHEWFLADCREKLVGKKRAILYFNAKPFHEDPAVVAHYRRIGKWPVLGNDSFVVVQL